MRLSPSFKSSQEQHEKRTSKTQGLNKYYLDHLDRLFPKLSTDAKQSACATELPPGRPIITIIEFDDKATVQSLDGLERPGLSPTSETTESASLGDVDENPYENAPSIASDESSGTVSPKNKRSSFGWGRKLPCSMPPIPARVGEPVTSRCRLGEASIEGNFTSIQYGTYNGRPPCYMVVDFRLVFQPSSTINWAKIQFRFGSSNTEASDAQVSKAFFPDELTGQYDISQDITGVSSNVGLGVSSCKATSGVTQQQARITKRRWRLQGTTEEHGGHYDTFCWKVFENPLSEDSVPRHFRTGMIAYLPTGYTLHAEHNIDFWVDISIEGTLRGLWPRHKKVKERRAIDSGLMPLDCNHIFDDDTLRNMVHDGNKTISDLGQAQKVGEAPPALPALPAAPAVSLDGPKKADPKENPTQTNATGYGPESSYQKLEVDENLVQMHANNEDVFRMPAASEDQARNPSC